MHACLPMNKPARDRCTRACRRTSQHEAVHACSPTNKPARARCTHVRRRTSQHEPDACMFADKQASTRPMHACSPTNKPARGRCTHAKAACMRARRTCWRGTDSEGTPELFKASNTSNIRESFIPNTNDCMNSNSPMTPIAQLISEEARSSKLSVRPDVLTDRK